MQTGTMQIQFCGDRTIHVIYRPDGTIPNHPVGFAVLQEPLPGKFQKTETSDAIILKTLKCGVEINKQTGALSFIGSDGKPFLQEVADGGKAITPATVEGTATNTIDQKFILDPTEGLYGLGQHPTGTMNYLGTKVHLEQVNTDIAVPVLLSSKGYGVFWNNPAITDVIFSKASDANPTVEWKSEFGDSIDYYVFYGPGSDQVIADYRALTGAVPMFGRWAWGYWQCKEHYASQQELLDVAARYRASKIPIDGIIQDWLYWAPHPWGSHQFDAARYPDPAKLTQELHAENIHIIISVWPRFEPGSDNYKAMLDAGNLYPSPHPGDLLYYDAFKPAAQTLYWGQISKELFADGFDGWWLDASEPDIHDRAFRDTKTAAGPGTEVFNAYPLMHTTSVYQGQRAENSSKRVFILTRSAYAGQQRNSIVAWSGDIQGDWGTFAKQIPDGLNFTYTGIPYWNTDIGGFTGSDPLNPGYAELFTRWFQFGSFCPMFRVHGTHQPKEMWRFDPETESILVKYDKLRYHLLPYIYSVSWMVTHDAYSMMRGLVMDFQQDPKVANIPDQYMFGPAIMVNPVTRPIIDHSAVTIPSSQWIDKNGQPGALSATYYQGKNFDEKKLERRDPVVSFNWKNPPDPQMERTNFSVRWEGFLLTDKAGEYTISMSADDAMRFWLDGKLIIEDWGEHGLSIKQVRIALPANAKIPVKIEYFQTTGEAIVDVKWSPPGENKDVPTRQVYLPAQTDWYNFWTGEKLTGGQTIAAPAPVETMPLYIRAGSILPYGPDIQYASQSVDPMELRIYRGADGTFTLYEDENDNYNYEKGVYATIPFSWSEKDQALTIGKRQGQFPGMLAQRTFRIVGVSVGHGVGTDSTPHPDVMVRYIGNPIRVPLAPSDASPTSEIEK
jgi:alpha-D-xyloside xylohydrolase